jgi:hypothetical protein
VLTIASLIGVVEKREGGWISYKGETLGQGLDSVSEIIERDGIVDELEMEILNRYGIKHGS